MLISVYRHNVFFHILTNTSCFFQILTNTSDLFSHFSSEIWVRINNLTFCGVDSAPSLSVRFVFVSSCLWESVCLICVACVCLSMAHVVLCFCFVLLRRVRSVLPVSLVCHFCYCPLGSL